MSDNMIDKVAIAQLGELLKDRLAGMTPEEMWAGLDEGRRGIQRAAARAALNAMREPTLAVQNAIWREIERQGFQTEDTEAAPIFRAGIDAALQDTTTGGER